jgi:hypothetical protein
MTEREVLHQLVEVRIKRILVRQQSEFELEMYNRTGRGVSPQEYWGILDKLFKEGFITRTTGKRGAATLHLASQE